VVIAAHIFYQLVTAAGAMFFFRQNLFLGGIFNTVVPLGDTDSTSMLSYSQRHYDVYISNYSNFVVRVLRTY
jgi:hypothetical protein